MANAPLAPSPDLEATQDQSKKRNLELPEQPQSQSGRRGRGAARWLFALGVVGLMGTAAYTLPQFGLLGGAKASENWITEPVVKGRLIVSVKEDGEVESASNLDLKCEVSGGSTILWLIEDGSRVKKGEEILRLDQSLIDDQLNAQKILYQKALATKIQAEQDHEAAKIAVEEYDKGLFLMEEQTAAANVKIAMENLRSAENLYNHTQKMFKKGFVTQQQLEADEFGVQRSKLELQSAETALKVLQDFTKLKMLTQLRSARDAAAARMRSEQAACELEKSKLDQLETQLGKCIITAPQPGMVIYAEIQQRGEDPVITEGLAVHENQTLIQLPDLSKMQVVVPVHETKVNQIRRGMPARIVVQDREYTGRVVSIASQPSEGEWWSGSGDVKQYATTVAIEGEIENLKPGMTAQVEIFVADLRDVLKVKVSAVVEQRGKFFVWVATPDGPERRPVILGPTNDKFVVIEDGVVEGEEVLLNPRAVLEEARQEDDDRDDSSTEIPGEIPERASQSRVKKSASEETPDGPQANAAPGKRPSLSFSDMDKDGDGRLTKAEAPDRMKQNFDKADTNKDGAVDAVEWAEVRKQMQAARNAAQPGGKKGPADRNAAE